MSVSNTTIAARCRNRNVWAEPITLGAWKSDRREVGRAPSDTPRAGGKTAGRCRIDIVTEGEQRAAFLFTAFLSGKTSEGIDCAPPRSQWDPQSRYKAIVPQVVAAAAAEGPRPAF